MSGALISVFANQRTFNLPPGAPTSVTATAGDGSATVTFTAPAFTGIPPGITGYLATSSPGGFTATGASSPLTITGLTNGTSYTINVQATNGTGYGAAGTSNSVTPAVPEYGLFAGGNLSGGEAISRITISSTGNAVFFGNLTSQQQTLAGCASSTRALFNGRAEAIDYVTISTAGNAASFGTAYSQPTLNGDGMAGCNSSTRGVWAGNQPSAGDNFSNVMSYSTIATLGNATFFGDLTRKRNSNGACSSSTRGCIGGGYDFGSLAGIDYVTIASTGNATSFGNLTVSRFTLAGCGSSTRGLFGGGGSSAIGNVIDYITIASTGNATDFGDLTINVEGAAALSSTTRGVWGGSYGPNSSVMSYVTIASTGNATSFGSLTNSGGYRAGASNCNGGL